METKNIIFAVIGSALALFVVALIIFNINESKKNTEDMAPEMSTNAPFHEQYPGLPEDNKFVLQSGDEIIDRFHNGTGVIFLGFKECPWCQKTAPLINKAATAEDVKVYYTDIRQQRENYTETYQEIVSILTPYLPKDEEGAVRISTPDISIVKNGEIVWRFKLETVPDEEKTPEKYWTEERQAKAIEEFKEAMKKLN